MPGLTFVLPHWLYWSGLIVFPLMAMYLSSRPGSRESLGRTGLGVGYLMLVTGGFVGLHRFYVRSLWGIVFIAPFIAVLYANGQSDTARDNLSLSRSDIASAEFKIETFEKQVKAGKQDAGTRLAGAREDLDRATFGFAEAEENFATWSKVAGMLAMVIAALLLIDAVLLPGLVRKAKAADDDHDDQTSPHADEAATGANDARAPPVGGSALTRAIETLSDRSGEFVAWWSVIAVFVYYYEVLARYLFNSPTNWAHEGMFLLFGMQYLISGAYAYLNDSHVRVDVFYARLSRRGKAMADILTSVFFFIFAGTLLVTGWIFMMDSTRVGEVSFTEWAIQYWPVKITITLGAALLLLQGLAKLMHDLAALGSAEEA